MKLYIIPAIIAVVAFGAWRLYQHGYDVSEMQNRVESAETLRAETALHARLANQESDERLAAETRAIRAETRSDVLAEDARQAAALARQRKDAGCPEQCFSVSWPSQ